MLNWTIISVFLSILLVYPGKIFGEGKLPPIEQRKIIGSWTRSIHPCTMSLEEVESSIYEVTRCYDGSGGENGEVVIKQGNRYVEQDNSFGEYYIIDKNGDIGVYDSQGLIETWKKTPSLWPKNDKVPKEDFTDTDKKRTEGLNCHTIGYRYGVTSVKSMKGLSINQEWDFAVPDRCKNKPEFKKGLNEGMKKVW